MVSFHKLRKRYPESGFWVGLDEWVCMMRHSFFAFFVFFASAPDADGKYTVELSASGQESDSNWLPIPEKDAYIILRMYGPSKAIQDGGYPFPELEVVK